jgi:hypothetical protein
MLDFTLSQLTEYVYRYGGGFFWSVPKHIPIGKTTGEKIGEKPNR